MIPSPSVSACDHTLVTKKRRENLNYNEPQFYLGLTALDKLQLDLAVKVLDGVKRRAIVSVR
jgi:hypothetical protein